MNVNIMDLSKFKLLLYFSVFTVFSLFFVNLKFRVKNLIKNYIQITTVFTVCSLVRLFTEFFNGKYRRASQGLL